MLSDLRQTIRSYPALGLLFLGGGAALLSLVIGTEVGTIHLFNLEAWTLRWFVALLAVMFPPVLAAWVYAQEPAPQFPLCILAAWAAGGTVGLLCCAVEILLH